LKSAVNGETFTIVRKDWRDSEAEWQAAIAQHKMNWLKEIRFKANGPDLLALSDLWVKAVCSLPSLTSLTLPVSHLMTSAAFDFIAAAPNLQVLDLQHCFFYLVTDSVVDAIFRNCRSLRRLRLRGASLLTDAAFVHVTECAALEQLCILDCGELTAESLRHIRALPKLTQLDVRGCRMG
jgi:hypothetical protein